VAKARIALRRSRDVHFGLSSYSIRYTAQESRLLSHNTILLKWSIFPRRSKLIDRQISLLLRRYLDSCLPKGKFDKTDSFCGYLDNVITPDKRQDSLGARRFASRYRHSFPKETEPPLLPQLYQRSFASQHRTAHVLWGSRLYQSKQ
jgi:hypothetical protein